MGFHEEHASLVKVMTVPRMSKKVLDLGRIISPFIDNYHIYLELNS